MRLKFHRTRAALIHAEFSLSISHWNRYWLYTLQGVEFPAFSLQMPTKTVFGASKKKNLCHSQVYPQIPKKRRKSCFVSPTFAPSFFLFFMDLIEPPKSTEMTHTFRLHCCGTMRFADQALFNVVKLLRLLTYYLPMSLKLCFFLSNKLIRWAKFFFITTILSTSSSFYSIWTPFERSHAAKLVT